MALSIGKPHREPSASTWSISKANAGPFGSSVASSSFTGSAFFFLPFGLTPLPLGEACKAAVSVPASAEGAVAVAREADCAAAAAAALLDGRPLGFLAGEARLGLAGSARGLLAKGARVESGAPVLSEADAGSAALTWLLPLLLQCDNTCQYPCVCKSECLHAATQNAVHAGARY